MKKVLLISDNSPRVIFLRTWEGLTTQDVVRGGARRTARVAAF